MNKLKDIFRKISEKLKPFKVAANIISWTLFSILIVCAAFLLYYFVATKVYLAKGDGYEPKFSLYTIISPSMTPSIKVYDVIVDVLVKNPKDIKIGDVITFTSSSPESMGKSITHRVVEIVVDKDGKYKYSTKGDYNPIKDSKPVPFNDISGRVLFKIPQLGRVQFFLASSAGWLIAIVLPALYIIIKDIIKILKTLGIDKKIKNSKLLLPLSKKQLYLPFKGFRKVDSVTDLDEAVELPKTKEEATPEIKKENISLDDAYNDLLSIIDKK